MKNYQKNSTATEPYCYCNAKSASLSMLDSKHERFKRCPTVPNLEFCVVKDTLNKRLWQLKKVDEKLVFLLH